MTTASCDYAADNYVIDTQICTLKAAANLTRI